MHPNVAPAIGLELDVEDGEVENYEVELTAETAAQKFASHTQHVDDF